MLQCIVTEIDSWDPQAVDESSLVKMKCRESVPEISPRTQGADVVGEIVGYRREELKYGRRVDRKSPGFANSVTA